MWVSSGNILWQPNGPDRWNLYVWNSRPWSLNCPWLLQIAFGSYSIRCVEYNRLRLAFLKTTGLLALFDVCCRKRKYHHHHWLPSFSNLDRSRSIRAKRSMFLIKSDLLQRIWQKSDLATPICANKRGRGLRHSVQTRTRWPRPLRPERSVRSFSPDWVDLVWQI